MAEDNRRDFSGLSLRVATGLALAALAVILVLLTPLWLLTTVAAAVACLGMWEYMRMIETGEWAWDAWVCLAASLLLPFAVLAGPAAAAASMGVALAAGMALSLAGLKDLKTKLTLARQRAWGLIYTSGLIAILLSIAGQEQGRMLLLFVIAAVVAADSGAYFAGHLWGSRKLAPNISPGKTWEGFAGGMACAALVGALFAGILLTDVPVLAGAGLGLVLGVSSVLGDLMESLVKRVHGVKDSGGIFPGHGGILDRIDGLLLAGPFMLLIRMLWWQ
jgi:phosphatidate cytidylyltransferase